METTNMFFKKFEVIGETKDEAMAQAAPMNLMVDATVSFNKWAKEHTTDNENVVKEWMKEYLKGKKYNRPNMGAYIVLQKAERDTRKRPYKEIKAKYETRVHTPQTSYVGHRISDNKEVFAKKTTKEAMEEAKKWVTENHESVTVVREWKAKENNALYATVEYTPSKGTQKCKMLVFGYVAE